MEQNKKQMTFQDSREALDYLVNKAWDLLSLEQRKILRPYKQELNYGNISVKRMDEALAKFGEIKKEIKLSI